MTPLVPAECDTNKQHIPIPLVLCESNLFVSTKHTRAHWRNFLHPTRGSTNDHVCSQLRRPDANQEPMCKQTNTLEFNKHTQFDSNRVPLESSLAEQQ